MSEKSIHPMLARLAFVNEWSDALVDHAVEACRGRGITDDAAVFECLKTAADDMSLAVLRTGGDNTLLERAAKTFGFENHEAFDAFRRANPEPMDKWNAQPASGDLSGRVVDVSYTTVIFETKHGAFFGFDKSRLQDEIEIGDKVEVPEGYRSPVVKVAKSASPRP